MGKASTQQSLLLLPLPGSVTWRLFGGAGPIANFAPVVGQWIGNNFHASACFTFLTPCWICDMGTLLGSKSSALFICTAFLFTVD